MASGRFVQPSSQPAESTRKHSVESMKSSRFADNPFRTAIVFGYSIWLWHLALVEEIRQAFYGAKKPQLVVNVGE